MKVESEPVVSFIVPALNEEQNLPPLFERLLRIERSLGLPVEILVIDDHSDDGTLRVAKEAARTHPQIRPHRKPLPHGLGRGIRAGLELARGRIGVVVMADGVDPLEKAVPKFCSAILDEGCHLVLLSRYSDRADSVGIPLSYKLYHRLFRFFTSTLLGIPHRDTTYAFRALDVDYARSLNLESDGFEISPETTIKTHFSGGKIGVVRGSQTRRVQGKSKFLFSKAAAGYARVLSLGCLLRIKRILRTSSGLDRKLTTGSASLVAPFAGAGLSDQASPHAGSRHLYKAARPGDAVTERGQFGGRVLRGPGLKSTARTGRAGRNGRPRAAVHLDLDGGAHIYQAHGWSYESQDDPLFATGLEHALDFFDAEDIRATLFVIAEDLDDPGRRELLRSAARRGHEVASHSLTHRKLTTLNGTDKRREIFESRRRIGEDLGVEVRGFRAPGFSVDRESLELIDAAGYTYDSSLFPHRSYARKAGMGAVDEAPHFPLDDRRLMELPLPAYMPLPLPFHPCYSLVLGTWYFRSGLARFSKTGAPLVLVFHLTDFADPLPGDRLHNWMATLYTLSHIDGKRKRQRCGRMMELVRKSYEVVGTLDLLEERALPEQQLGGMTQ